MPYAVQFVGLVCFFRERGVRLALLPDGRNPGDGIDPHYGSIIVDRNSIVETHGWADVAGGNFLLPPCEIVIAGAATPGVLDAAQQDRTLPQLRQIDPNFEIDPARAETIARVRIQQGRLTVHRLPGGTALISQLDVPHDEPIEITVKPDDGALRSIVVKEGTEIAIANMARGGIYRQPRSGNGHHFRIYEKLSVRPVTLREPPVVLEDGEVTESKSRHVLFSKRVPISIYTDCSNTGCC